MLLSWAFVNRANFYFFNNYSSFVLRFNLKLKYPISFWVFTELEYSLKKYIILALLKNTQTSGLAASTTFPVLHVYYIVHQLCDCLQETVY